MPGMPTQHLSKTPAAFSLFCHAAVATRYDRQQLLITHFCRSAELIRVSGEELRRFAVSPIKDGVGRCDVSLR
jgi:hypothetical protein